MEELTREELKHFSEQLAQRYLTDVDGYIIPAFLIDAPNGVHLVPLPSAEDVNQIDESTIKDNELYFYTKSYKQAVFNLLRHFRNCAIHKGRIKRQTRNGKSFYYFEDKNAVYFSMRGNVALDIWDEFIEELYKVALENKVEKKQKTANKK